MPRSSGVYSPPSSSWNPAVNANPATLADWNALLADIVSALTQSVSRDGQTAITGNIPMGSNKLTGLAAGTGTGDSVRWEQIAPLAAGVAVAGAGANTDITSLSSHPVGQMVGQVLTSSTGTQATGTTLIPFDDTIPQNTEGDQYLSLAITPKNASSTLEIEVVLYGSSNQPNTSLIAALFQDATANALAATEVFQTTASARAILTLKYVMTAGTTSATTFKVRAGASVAGTFTLNGTAGNRIFGGVANSRITIKEYLP